MLVSICLENVVPLTGGFIASALDAWAVQAQLPNLHSLQDIGHQTEGPCIGVDAIYFLEELHYRQKESLAPFLGALSPSTEREVVKAIQDLESSGCKVYFFFNGLNTYFDEDSTAISSTTIAKYARGAESYNSGKFKSASEQIKVLGMSGIKMLQAGMIY